MGCHSGAGGNVKTVKDKPLPNFEPIVEQYGSKIAFSKKFKTNVGVFINKAKSGEYNMENWFASELFKLRSYYGYDDGRGMSSMAQDVNLIIQNAKVGNKKTAQKLLDSLTESQYNLWSEKYRKNFDRSYIRRKS